ncbi:MAG: Ig-like domain-containing protein [Lachnospiraceae bacterium]|nr:Ig-like domain-containing protein [Lachnospiraceae bacterium]
MPLGVVFAEEPVEEIKLLDESEFVEEIATEQSTTQVSANDLSDEQSESSDENSQQSNEEVISLEDTETEPSEEETTEKTINNPFYIKTEDEISRVTSSYLENTETNKVAIDETVPIAETSVYKDIDYSFLKDYDFGGCNSASVKVTFDSMEDLKVSQDVRLREGNIIRTKGYYQAGDGGGAVYEISKVAGTGSVQLANGLYAILLPDTYTCTVNNGSETWVVVNIKQFGAKADGTVASEAAFSTAANFANKYMENNDDIFRGIVYIPTGEYKCDNEVHFDKVKNLNVVGDGSSSVLFTDNDYRDQEGYAEHFFQSWYSENMFFGNFRIEAREVDLYHYMRQLTLLYCNQVYIYNVDMIVPQESYSSYYFEDKQYSNFCAYTGNHNVTVDDCTMVQLSGTYRGANIGILDIWSAKTSNITVMNCDLYGNARDEQIGMFSTKYESSGVSNVDFINNTIHSSQLKYTDIIGTRTMCFTLAYTDSQNVDDIRIAGNHFICETDSKFMTFANITNCVVENNIIEIITSNDSGASVFDSSNSDPDNVIIRNNEFFLTSVDGTQGKGGVATGYLTMENNRFISDMYLSFYFAHKGAVAKNNEIVFLRSMCSLAEGTYEFTGNTAHLYNSVRLDGYGFRRYFIVTADATKGDKVQINNNTIYDYKRIVEKRGSFAGLFEVNTSVDTLEFSGNTYNAPNKKYTWCDLSQCITEGDRKDTDINPDGSYTYYDRIFRMRTFGGKNLIIKDNKLQGTMGYYGSFSEGQTYTATGNETLPYREDISTEESIVSSIDILYNGQKTSNVTVTSDTVTLDKIVRIVAETDEDGNITKEEETTEKEVKWYTSVDGIASISDTGVVTRHLYGDVKVFAVATDGSGVYGECTIHFQKNQAREITLAKDSLDLQPGLKFYADYTVLPEGTSQNVLWTSSNEAVATVSKTGTITAVAKGDATITATTTDGSNLTANIQVHVTPVTVKKIDLDKSWLYCENSQIGTTVQLSPSSYTPDNAENKSIGRWESTDSSVVTVNQNGLVTIVGGGIAEIRGYSTDDYCYGKCTFYVQPPKVNNFKAAQVTMDSATFTWDKVESGYGYYLYQRKSGESAWTTVKCTNSNDYMGTDTTSYTINSLSADTEYEFCIRSFITNWETGERQLYESNDNIIKVKTYSYQPVTSITGNTETFTVLGLGDASFIYQESNGFFIHYKPYTNNMSNLDFTYKIEDESIAVIEEIQNTTTSGQKKIKIRGLKYGTTNLKVTANDNLKKTVTIPVGVIPANTLASSTAFASAVYNKITVEFEGLEDESNIDGYMLQKRVGHTYTDIAYIPKSGADTYSHVHKDLTAETTYNYAVRICLKDGDTYFKGNPGAETSATVPAPTQAKTLTMGSDSYVVKGNNTIEVSAQVGPEGTSTNQLYWEIAGGKYATIERVETEDEESLVDYARVTGVLTGVTKIKAVTIDGSDLETTARLIVAPEALANIHTDVNLDSVNISWDKCLGASGYYVYKWNENKDEFVLLTDTKETCYTDTDVKENTAYRYKISAYLLYDNTVYEGQISEEIGVATAKYDFGIQAAGYVGIYDGQSHNGVTLTGINSDTDKVTYSTDNKNWSSQMPVVKDVKDSTDIYIRVERTGRNQPYCVKVAATVTPCGIDLTDIKLVKATVDWNGKVQKPSVVSSTCVKDKDYTVSYAGGFKNAGTYTVTVKGTGNYTGSKSFDYKIQVIKGHKYSVSGYIYKVTGSKTVSVAGITNKNKKTVTIKSTVKLSGKSYKVTAIEANAFKKCKKLTKVTIGKNVKTIGKNAFYKSAKLKKIVIKSKILKKVGKNALKGINKKAIIQVPKSKKTKYKKLFKKSTGFKTTMKIK